MGELTPRGQSTDSGRFRWTPEEWEAMGRGDFSFLSPKSDNDGCLASILRMLGCGGTVSILGVIGVILFVVVVLL